LTSLVSSTIPTECGPAWSSRTIPCRSSRKGVVVPAVLAEQLLQGPRRHVGADGEAIAATLVWGMSQSGPETYPGRRPRVSLRGKPWSNCWSTFLRAGLSLRICGMPMLVSP
jgi:hypothetical protein